MLHTICHMKSHVCYRDGSSRLIAHLQTCPDHSVVSSRSRTTASMATRRLPRPGCPGFHPSRGHRQSIPSQAYGLPSWLGPKLLAWAFKRRHERGRVSKSPAGQRNKQGTSNFEQGTFKRKRQMTRFHDSSFCSIFSVDPKPIQTQTFRYITEPEDAGGRSS